MLTERLKELRKTKGVPQHEIAAALGISRSTYTKYETGEIGVTTEMLQGIADYYGVSTDYLLERTDVLSPNSEDVLTKTEFALNGEIRELTEIEKQDVLAYIRFRKAQKANNE